MARKSTFDTVDESRFGDLDAWYRLPPEVRKRVADYDMMEAEGNLPVPGETRRSSTKGRMTGFVRASAQKPAPGVYRSGIRNNIYTDEYGRRLSSREASRRVRAGATMFGVPVGSTDQRVVSSVWGNSPVNPYSGLYPTWVNQATKQAYRNIEARRNALVGGTGVPPDEAGDIGLQLKDQIADDTSWFNSLTKRQRKQFSELSADRQRHILGLEPAKRLKEGRVPVKMTKDDEAWYNNVLTDRQRQQFDWLPVQRRNFILGQPAEDRLKPGRARTTPSNSEGKK